MLSPVLLTEAAVASLYVFEALSMCSRTYCFVALSISAAYELAAKLGMLVATIITARTDDTTFFEIFNFIKSSFPKILIVRKY